MNKKYKINLKRTGKCDCPDCIKFGKLPWFYIKPDVINSRFYLVDRTGILSIGTYSMIDIIEVPFIIDTSNIEKELDFSLIR